MFQIYYRGAVYTLNLNEKSKNLLAQQEFPSICNRKAMLLIPLEYMQDINKMFSMFISGRVNKWTTKLIND